MTYEPKAGDHVILRGVVSEMAATMAYVRLANPCNSHDVIFVDKWLLEPELSGEPTGPQAKTVAEHLEKLEARMRGAENAIEHMATGQTVRLWADELSRRHQQLVARLVALEEGVYGARAEPAPFVEHPSWRLQGKNEVRDAQGRVLKSKTLDVDPQGDWLTARAVGAPAESPADETRHAQLCRLIRENGQLRALVDGAATRLAQFVENSYGNSRGEDAATLRALVAALKREDAPADGQ